MDTIISRRKPNCFFPINVIMRIRVQNPSIGPILPKSRRSPSFIHFSLLSITHITPSGNPNLSFLFHIQITHHILPRITNNNIIVIRNPRLLRHRVPFRIKIIVHD
uniref:Uncharacterized protein n=1 Tax=Opuntia streptacantha TaxID=393608 RepID=A0A7C9DND5_OPUST